MKREIRILAIVMIAIFAFSLALAGPTATIAQPAVSDQLFVADMDGVLLNMDLSVPYTALQPSIVYEELTNIEDNYLVSGSADIGADVYTAYNIDSVLKTPVCMLVSESHAYNHKEDVLSVAYRKPETFRDVERVSRAER